MNLFSGDGSIYSHLLLSSWLLQRSKHLQSGLNAVSWSILQSFCCTAATIFTNQLCVWVWLSYRLLSCSACIPIMDNGVVATTTAITSLPFEQKQLLRLLLSPWREFSQKQLFPVGWRHQDKPAPLSGPAACGYANEPVLSSVFATLISRAESTDLCQWLKPASNVNTSAELLWSDILALFIIASFLLHHRHTIGCFLHSVGLNN